MLSPRLKPFFTYYGGKWRIAPKYPPPETDTIIEPFAGSAGYSLCYPEKNVILVEKNPVVAETWEYLIRVSPEEIINLPDLESDQTVEDLHVCAEARYLIGWWLNKGSTAPGKSPSKWMRSNIRPKSYWGKEIRERIAQQVEAIRHWKVLQSSYEESPDIYGTWFVDPPYIQAGKYYPKGSNEIDYSKLATYCTDIWKGQVIVCEAQGASWLPFTPFCDIKTLEGKNGHKTGKEVIWTKTSQKSLFSSFPNEHLEKEG